MFYLFHRCMHISKLLYVSVHLEHHRHKRPTLLTNYKFTVADLFIEAMLTTFVADAVVRLVWPQRTYLNALLYGTYVQWYQIASHANKRLPPVTAFPPLAPLYNCYVAKRMRPDGLRHHDAVTFHALHHSHPTGNFGITPWVDHLLGTNVVAKAHGQSSATQSVAIVGAGALGIYVASKLGQEHNVHLIFRTKDAATRFRLRTPRINGEDISASTRIHVHSSIETVPQCDFILLTLKTKSLTCELMRAIERMCHTNTIVVPLMNGVRFYDALINQFGTRVLGAVATIVVYTDVVSSDIVVSEKVVPRIDIGPTSDGVPPNYCARTVDAIKSHFDVVLLTTPSRTWNRLWSKNVFIVGLGSVGSLTRHSLKHMLADDDATMLMTALNNECHSIACARGIEIDSRAIFSTQMRFRDLPDADAFVSCQRDYQQGHTSELADQLQHLIECARDVHVPCDALEAVHSDLFLDRRERGGDVVTDSISSSVLAAATVSTTVAVVSPLQCTESVGSVVNLGADGEKSASPSVSVHTVASSDSDESSIMLVLRADSDTHAPSRAEISAA